MRNSNCSKCGLAQVARNVCVWGDGPKNAKVMIVGEAPGRDEDQVGKPFQGRSGALLRTELSKAGLSQVYITNVVKCRPPDNRTPTKEEIKACSEYLAEEIATLKPTHVMALGATASKAVLKKSKITLDHGRLVEINGFTGMPAYHPAYALRDPSKLAPLRQDIERFSRAVQGISTKSEARWEIVQRDNLDRFIEEFSACDEFAFDTETTGLFQHDRRGAVRCLQIAFGAPGREKAWVIPLDIRGSPFPTRKTRESIMALIFDIAKGKKAIAQNGKFDNLWLNIDYGQRFALSFDTGLAHHVLDENSPHGLKEMTRAYLDEEDYDLPLKEKLNPTNLMRYYEYAAKDALYTLRLKRIFQAKLVKDRTLRKLFYRLVMRAARAFEEIEQVGLTIDRERFEKTQIEVRQQLDASLKKLNELAGRTVNWNSPQQVADVFFNDLGLIPVVINDSGTFSTAEATLVALKDEHPIVSELVRYRELDKFLGTYLEGWREFMVGDQLHLSYKLHGTVTGRYSSRLHQVPRDGRIRNLVVAPPGWDFVQADFSQAELRIVAEVSQDIEMITCFRRKIDIHWRTLLFTIQAGGAGEYVQPALDTATQLKGKPVKTLHDACELMLAAGHEPCIKIWKGWKEARKKAKGINFGFVYGMMAPKFVEYAKLKYGFEPTLDEAEGHRRAFFELYRGLVSWHDRQRRIVCLNGEVRNLAGRLRRLPGAMSSDRSLKSEAERQSINAPIQGFIGDFKAMALVEIHEKMPRDRLKVVGEVHDSILMLVRKDSHYLLKQAAEIMRHPALLDEFGIDLAVPIEVDFEVGPWGAGKPFTTH